MYVHRASVSLRTLSQKRACIVRQVPQEHPGSHGAEVFEEAADGMMSSWLSESSQGLYDDKCVDWAEAWLEFLHSNQAHALFPSTIAA
jgi:hypothetical protein